MSGVRLYLLRHAKSSWAEPGQADFDRPLAERGHASASAIGALFARETYLPDLVLCSTAQRTRETLARLLPQFRHEMTVRLTRAVYDAVAEDLLAIVRQSGAVPSLLVIGHNPSIEDLGTEPRAIRRRPVAGENVSQIPDSGARGH